jgi:multiple sugar transport system substrate-binding protein
MSHIRTVGAGDVSRRTFIRTLGLSAAAIAGAPVLAACSGGGGGSIKFWDMPFGAAAYNNAAEAITTGYKPTSGLPPASYQIVQWTNFFQTYATAVVSRTNPSISTGGSFQSFQLAAEGGIHYADNAINNDFKKNGIYDDYLPGVLAHDSTPQGYPAVPWMLEPTVLYYGKSLHDKLGLQPPQTWDELYSNGVTFQKKLGISYMIMGAGPANNSGYHSIMSMIFNNGGALFKEDQSFDIVSDRNVEAVEFMLKLVKDKIISPDAINYSQSNELTTWQSKQGAFGWEPANYGSSQVGSSDVLVASPMTGPHGDKGALMFVDSIMMYSNHNPSIKSTEAFLSHYLKSINVYWKKNLVSGTPAFKSILSLP